MRLTEAALPVFARHETFHPRYGWFRKAYQAVAEDENVFEADDAPVRIGVGKNMVRSIRFWGLAARLYDERSMKGRRKMLLETGEDDFGHRLFGEDGWDPWMEDPGTLWLLHWRLLAPPCRLPVWWFAFNDFHPVEFTEDELEEAVAAQLETIRDWGRASRSAIRKDVSALLRTYATPERRGRASLDDHLDSPLRELNLIQRAPSGFRSTGRYRFVLGAKPLLPSAVATAAALEFADRRGAGEKSIALTRLVHEPGSPGRIFRLTEPDLLATLEPAARQTRGLRLTSSAGAHLLTWTGSAHTVAHRLLDDYYASGDHR